MKTNVRVAYDAELTIEKANDDGNKSTIVYATFNGNVNSDGVPQISYYIPVDFIDVYKENVAEFRKQWADFQKVVFDKADEVTASLASSKTEA